jgi:hypothetical protein
MKYKFTTRKEITKEHERSLATSVLVRPKFREW